ncbi:MAG: hypothetical protein IJV67_04290 [Clostridia bacterium]|nr:hypothetical protein [Clostridia bacterium]
MSGSSIVPIMLWVLGAVAVALLLWVLFYILVAYIVYTKTMRRTSKEKWARGSSADLDEDANKMSQIGDEWCKANAPFKTDVHIVNDGLNLYGEYYDYGNDKCMVLLSGRTECLRYGYYFTKPYVESGYNVLLIDPRAHGNSDGEFNTTGREESRDTVLWFKLLKEKFGIRSVVLHCICIGSATGIYTILNKECPNFVEGIVTEGMYVNFGESMKNHLKELKKPVFMLHNFIDMWMKHYTGYGMYYGPIDVIHKLKTPLLMLHSKEDLYSTPELAEKLYKLAGSKRKRLVWFDKGAHSRLRITATEKYDACIKSFLGTIKPVRG